ncbi:hypothetical protein ABIE33_006420 [Ensifer sp. 4252]
MFEAYGLLIDVSNKYCEVTKITRARRTAKAMNVSSIVPPIGPSHERQPVLPALSFIVVSIL